MDKGELPKLEQHLTKMVQYGELAHYLELNDDSGIRILLKQLKQFPMTKTEIDYDALNTVRTLSILQDWRSD